MISVCVWPIWTDLMYLEEVFLSYFFWYKRINLLFYVRIFFEFAIWTYMFFLDRRCPYLVPKKGRGAFLFVNTNIIKIIYWSMHNKTSLHFQEFCYKAFFCVLEVSKTTQIRTVIKFFFCLLSYPRMKSSAFTPWDRINYHIWSLHYCYHSFAFIS